MEAFHTLPSLPSGVAGKLKGHGDRPQDMKKEIPVHATKTSFEIIETLISNDVNTLSGLREELEHPKSTIHDHLRTLERLGYVCNDEGTYEISTKFLEIGGRKRNSLDLYRTAKPEIDNLASDLGEHMNLMIEEDGLGMLLYLATGDQQVHLDYAYDGMRSKLHMTAGGKSILAFMDEERVEEIIDEHGLTAITENTITDREQLLDQLETIQDQKFAFDFEEAIIGMRGVASPILDRTGEVKGAVSLYSPLNQLSDEKFNEELPNVIRQTANVIEINLNY